MLELSNVRYSYSRKAKVIEDFSMTLENGTICGLLGKNGTGKSTLIYLICGLLKAQSGTISYDGYTPIERKPAFLNKVFLVPEEFSLPSITLEEYVRVNSPFYPNFDKAQLNKYLEIFELTPDIHLGKLSMGQKKKAFLSFAMATNTPLLILDEPTNGLDITSKRNFRKAIMECMNDNKCIIISTHQLYDVEKILDHLVIIDSKGVLLNESIFNLSQKYKFSFTTDNTRAENALISINVPGGFNIAEKLTDPSDETEINLETLFEMTQRNIR